MALMIREYTGDKFIKTNEIKAPLNLTEATIETNVSDEAIDPNSLMVEIEGIHAYPHATRNFTRYMPKCLKNSISLYHWLARRYQVSIQCLLNLLETLMLHLQWLLSSLPIRHSHSPKSSLEYI